jgi:Protein of unknown function (DUF402)
VWRYEPGSVIRRLEVLHGRVWLESPVTVVSDDEAVLAIRLDPGSAFTFPQHPFGAHPWSGRSAWGATVVLQLLRTGDHYGVWKFFDPDGTFLYWYVNFEAPVVRREAAVETDDHGLDLIVHPDGRREWKDVADLHRQRVEGRIGLDTVGAVLAAAAEVTDLLDTDTHWWARWDDWAP